MSLKTIVSSSAFLLLGESAIDRHMVVNGLKLNTKVDDKYTPLEGIEGASDTAQSDISSDAASDDFGEAPIRHRPAPGRRGAVGRLPSLARLPSFISRVDNEQDLTGANLPKPSLFKKAGLAAIAFARFNKDVTLKDTEIGDELIKEDGVRLNDFDSDTDTEPEAFTEGKGLWMRVLTDAENKQKQTQSVSNEKAFVLGLLGLELDVRKTTNFDKTWESHHIQKIIDTKPILQLKDTDSGGNIKWELNTDITAKELGEGKAYISYMIKDDLDNEESTRYQCRSSKDFERTLALRDIESQWIGNKHVTTAVTSTKDMFTMSCGRFDVKCQAEKVALWGITKYLGVKPNSVPINLMVERELVHHEGEIMLHQTIKYGKGGDVSYPYAIEHWFRQVQ